MPVEDAQHLSARRVPEPDGFVRAGRSDYLSVGAVCNGADVVGMTALNHKLRLIGLWRLLGRQQDLALSGSRFLARSSLRLRGLRDNSSRIRRGHFCCGELDLKQRAENSES